ncbi:MAG TPA: hypothetical protein VEJ18_16470 [Planctomycetota bacterium]|nr:hypothetical protein [Planctomycetota bacterium]
MRRLALLVAAIALSGAAAWRLAGKAQPPPPAAEAPAAHDPPGAAAAAEPLAVPAAPSPAPASSDLEAVGPDLLRRYREARRAEGRGSRMPLRFEEESRLGLREARLFAAAFPGQAETLGSRLARDAASPYDDRWFGVFLLHALARSGRPTAAAALRALASDPDPALADCALAGLADTDLRGEHRDLYARRAEEGSTAAVDALSRWPDPAARARLQGLMRHPDPTLRARAEASLRKHDLGASPELESALVTILRDRAYDRMQDLHWALQVTRQGDYPRVRRALRERLDAGLDAAVHRWSRRPPGEPLPDFEAEVAAAPSFAASTGDGFFDDVLVACSELGVALQPRETARLRTFGYGVDPVVRLRELLAHGR